MNNEVKSYIYEKLKHIPDKSGVYFMKDSKSAIIYIGKAKSLKKRVSSYFNNSNKDAKTTALVEHIRDIDYILTENEVEALILEAEMIRKHKPHYNILLKDQKSFPFIAVTNEHFPRVIKARNVIDKENSKKYKKYYGPYVAAEKADNIVKFVIDNFKLRRCKYDFPLKRPIRPCLYHHIGKCTAPCADLISEEDYDKTVEEAIMVLEGNVDELTAKLKQKMFVHAEKLEFEAAKDLRDKIDLFQVQLQALKNDYQNSGGVSLSEWKNFSTEIVREEAKREEYNRWLKDFANHYLPFIIVEDQLRRVLSQIELEQNAKKKAIAKEELTSQILKDKLSEFLNGLGFDGIFSEQILSFIQEKAFESSNLSIIFDFSEAQTTRIISQIYEKLAFDKSLVRRAIKELRASLANTKKIRDLKLDHNIDGYEEYTQKKQEIERNIEKIILQLDQVEREIADQEIFIEQQKKELIKAKELYEKDLKNKSISHMSERAIWVYSKLEDQLVERQSKILQDEFLKCFTAIINKDNFIDGIIIDKNINVIPYKFINVSYSQIDNYIKNNEHSRLLDHFDKKYITDINDLRLGMVDFIKLPVQITAPFSQGERQVYIMALYLALLKTSNKDIPFFIDTPFARIVSYH